MKVYIPYKEEKLYHPEDTHKIVDYLRAHGELKIRAKTVEDYWYDFSDTRCAGWLGVDEETLESFAEYLSEIDI